MSFDINVTRLGFVNTCWIARQASRCQQTFSKPCLVNLISKDTHLEYSLYTILRYPLNNRGAIIMINVFYLHMGQHMGFPPNKNLHTERKACIFVKLCLKRECNIDVSDCKNKGSWEGCHYKKTKLIYTIPEASSIMRVLAERSLIGTYLYS